MILFFKRVLKDIFGNFFLNTVTVITIALSVLIFSSFMLFCLNADNLIRLWMRDMHIMVYMKAGTPRKDMDRTALTIRQIGDVREVRFVSRDEALKRFRTQLANQSALLDHIKENPLPDAFEVYIAESPRSWEKIEPVARQIIPMPSVEQVEYGSRWLGKTVHILNMLRLTGYGLGGIFFLAVVFFVANTIRLILYSRRQEVEIMRLVGASEGFIKDPLYLQSLILGLTGGGAGLGILFAGFRFLTTSRAGQPFSAIFQIEFFSPETMLFIVGGSMLVGWTGCFVSLRQFLK